MNQNQIVVSNNLELYELLLLNGSKQTTSVLIITFIMKYIYLQDSSGSRPNLLETTYRDDLYVDTLHSEPYDIGIQTVPTKGDTVTTTELATGSNG